MSELRESFPTLEDLSTGAGKVLHSAQDTIDDAAGRDGAIGFSFKDSNGKVVLPQLNNEGAIVVSFDAGTTLRGAGKVPAGSASEVTIAEVTLAADQSYTELCAHGSCYRDATFRVLYVDDAAGVPVETELAKFRVGSGQYSHKWNLNKDVLSTVGGTGDQKFRLVAMNENNQSEISGEVSINQLA